MNLKEFFFGKPVKKNPDALCIDCKHCFFANGEYYCERTKNESKNRVDGTTQIYYGDCKTERYFNWKHNCGPNAIYFEPKETKIDDVALDYGGYSTIGDKK